MLEVRNILVKELYYENEKRLETLKNGLTKDEDWLLCLGAGVSQSCGMPNWSDLLSRMLARTLAFYPAQNEKNKVIKGISSFVERGPDTRYLEK